MRKYGGFECSPLSNPFKVGRDGELPEVLDKYEEWLINAILVSVPDVVEQFNLLDSSSVLGCWCCNKSNAGDKPWLCHCDVIAHVYFNQG